MGAGYVMFSTSLILFFTAGMIWGLYKTWGAFIFYFKKNKLKKYNLNEYNIVYNKDGFPSLLVNKEDANKIVFI